MSDDPPAGEFTGRAELVLDGGTRPVTVHLRDGFQPLDGRHHWWGRVEADPALDALVPTGGAVVVRTPSGEATGRLADRDPWGRYRVTGIGPPPY
jgi:hypothetical protein